MPRNSIKVKGKLPNIVSSIPVNKAEVMITSLDCGDSMCSGRRLL